MSPGETIWPNPDDDSRIVWITPSDPMPDICITCGMFTDRKFAASHIEFQKHEVQTTAGSVVALGCLLHLLGPIGWMLALLLPKENNQSRQKTRKRKHKIKLPQCILCHTQQPAEPAGWNPRAGHFGFHVHPKFERQLKVSRAESAAAAGNS